MNLTINWFTYMLMFYYQMEYAYFKINYNESILHKRRASTTCVCLLFQFFPCCAFCVQMHIFGRKLGHHYFDTKLCVVDLTIIANILFEIQFLLYLCEYHSSVFLVMVMLLHCIFFVVLASKSKLATYT